MKMENSHLNISKDDDNMEYIQQLELASKTYKKKTKNKKWNKILIRLFFALFLICLLYLFLPRFLINIQGINMRIMTQQNGHLEINQNYEKVDPYDKKYTYIPIVGTGDIHGNFFPKINNIKIGNKTLTYKIGRAHV